MPQKEISTNHKSDYAPDILGGSFEKRTLQLENDYEGVATATLIRSKCNSSTKKAVLYIHGFNDYFFQKELATNFNTNGYHFYALDLRKYGRSYLQHQKLNNVRSLKEYDEEITLALAIIKQEGNDHLLLNGHSTGGLIITYFASRNPNSTLFHGLVCNSPFYEYNLGFIERNLGVPLLSSLGKRFPKSLVPAGFSKMYGYSLHQDHYGEWNYSLIWKPNHIEKVNLGFIHAIHQAQQQVQNDCMITVPLLVLHSDKSIYVKKWTEKLKTADAVLNVKHIAKYASLIKGNVTVTEIQDGMHDLILSKKEVREKVYKTMFDWIQSQFRNEN